MESTEMVTREEAFPSRWLQAADFPKPAVLEIVETTQETVRGNDGLSVKKLTLHFRGQRKALICNVTNFNAISQITGESDSDNWIGHSIELYATTTAMAGKTTPCIRVRAPVAMKKVAPAKAAFVSESENPAPYEDEAPFYENRLCVGTNADGRQLQQKTGAGRRRN
jgi:hypothetical protein